MTASPSRLITFAQRATGRTQMALDALLLEWAADQGQSSCRWYQWSGPTISLGYFQQEMPAELRERFRSLPVVRRLTGGGAILHHHELTYSLTLAPSHPLANEPRRLYDLVHDAVVAELRAGGISASLRGESHSELGGNFLCFSRGDSFDVVCGGYKILGSAQRRRRGAVLQHGSLLWARSEWAPEFPGICDLSPVQVTQEALERCLRDVLVNVLGGGFEKQGVLTAEQLARLAELEREFGDPC